MLYTLDSINSLIQSCRMHMASWITLSIFNEAVADIPLRYRFFAIFYFDTIPLTLRSRGNYDSFRQVECDSECVYHSKCNVYRSSFFFGCSIGLYPRITARILDLFECVSYSIVVVFVRFFQLQEKIKCTETYIDLLRTRRNLYSMIVVFFPPVFEFKWVLNFHQALAEA